MCCAGIAWKSYKKPHNDECRERIRTISERTLTGKARMNAYKDRIAETERVKEKRRARNERGAGDVLMEPGNKADEQVAVRHADASGGDIRESQHEEDKMRDIQVGKAGPEATGEEHFDKWRNTVRFEHEAPNASASSEPCVALEYPARSGTQEYLCRRQVMMMTTYKFLRWMHSTRWMGERDVTSETCWNGIEEKMHALEGKVWKSDQKVVRDDKITLKIVMDEELVQNDAMDEELVRNGVMDGIFVKNFVMDVKIDPKVVMDLSKFKVGGWNSLQPINLNLLDKFIDENKRCLLIGIPSRDPFFVTQYFERLFVCENPNVKLRRHFVKVFMR